MTPPRARIALSCDRCGTYFERRPSDVAKGKRHFCSRSCHALSREGANNPKWRGGQYGATSGYVYIYAPEHPHATQAGYVMEHRLVMEKRLGRYLDPAEQVHHINHAKKDNRDENLELMPNASVHRVHHAYYKPTPCGSCAKTIERSVGHRRRWSHAFCSRRCAALYASRCAALPGEACHSAKLTEAAVRDIRQRVAAGESRVSVAPHFGVTHSTVARIVARKTWRHVS